MPTLQFLSPQQVARALGGDINGVNSILAPGPGHSSADRSLSVKIDANAPDGFLVNSFAGDDVIRCRDYVRQKCDIPEFKPNSGRKHASSDNIAALFKSAMQRSSENGPRKPTATFDYVDENGKVLYQALKYGTGPGKTFRQRRPDGNGGYIWKLDDVRRVLYRLPELLQYPNATVFVCEGEKDADRVASLHCATTVASGRWKDVDLQILAGRDIVILQDADEAGEKKALAAAKVLHPIATTLRVVLLPGLTGHPNNKDVSDWLDADPSRAEKLANICFDTPIWEPTTEEPAQPCSDSKEDEEPPDEKAASLAPKAAADEIPSKPARQRLIATPFVWRDPATIPPRKWIYGWHYIRRFTSATIAPGALGKSSLQLVEAIAIALKLPLLGIMPMEQTNVWYWNGEDPAEETQRRIAAICARYEIDGKQLEGRLFTDTGRLTPIKLAALKKGEIAFDADLIRDLGDTIRESKIGVAIFDPFISVHDIPESDNTNVDATVKCFGHIADATNISIEFAHHVRKPSAGQAETTVDDARGASALIFAVRSGRVLNRMNKDQAAELKIEQPRFYFRSDNGKANLRPPEAAQWWHLANVDLPNGDQVGVVEPWAYPDPMARITTAHMREIRTRAAEGGYRKDPRAANWIGRAVAEIVGLDLEDEGDRKTVNAALAVWFKNKVLDTEDHKDDERKTRAYVIPGNWSE